MEDHPDYGRPSKKEELNLLKEEMAKYDAVSCILVKYILDVGGMWWRTYPT